MPKVTQWEHQSWDWIWALPTVGQLQLEAPSLAVRPESLLRLYSGRGASRVSCPRLPARDPSPLGHPRPRGGLGWSVTYVGMLVNPHYSI